MSSGSVNDKSRSVIDDYSDAPTYDIFCHLR